MTTPSEDPRDAVTAPEIAQEQTEPVATAPPAPVVSVVPMTSDRSAQTVGRRKEAIVRVRLVPGTGVFTLNGTSLERYFPNKVHQQLVREPLLTVNKPEAYDVIGNLSGGGTSGQAGALRLGIARALIELNVDDRPALKKAGFLTRDARVKERKKYGLKKARKAPQYSKR
ncbi:MAG: 30S ribosomal protein S9 [Pseudonocardiaceae bacterium]